MRLRQAGEPAALCTVLLTRGSTPGKETMKMLVRADRSTVGSVGGGCVEAEMIDLSMEVLADDRARTRTFTLNQADLPESGLICGGQVTILVEPVVPPVLVLLGGIREIIGAGTLFAQAELMFGESARSWTLQINPDYPGFLLAVLPPGAFFGLAILIVAKNWIDLRPAPVSEPDALPAEST